VNANATVKPIKSPILHIKLLVKAKNNGSKKMDGRTESRAISDD
jgi:hypothetical protein